MTELALEVLIYRSGRFEFIALQKTSPGTSGRAQMILLNQQYHQSVRMNHTYFNLL
jgi:hypothetical protein